MPARRNPTGCICRSSRCGSSPRPLRRIARLENTEALIEISETILGPNRSAPQANVFDLRGEMIGAGYYSRLIEQDVKGKPWYRAVMGAGGDRVMLPPHIT